jgi:hypothetical protein
LFTFEEPEPSLTMIDAGYDTGIGVSIVFNACATRSLLTDPDTHEGAEGPMVGAVAAFGGLMAGLGTDTTEFSHRLKKKEDHASVEALARTVTNGEEEAFDPKKGITSKQFNHMAYRMAKKSYEEDPMKNFTKPRSSPNFIAIRRKVAEKKAGGGRGYQIASATSHFVCDLSVTGAKGECRHVSVIVSLTTRISSGCALL